MMEISHFQPAKGKKLQNEKFPLTGGTLTGSMRAIAVSAVEQVIPRQSKGIFIME
jgi:hypothetical protein